MVALHAMATSKVPCINLGLASIDFKTQAHMSSLWSIISSHRTHACALPVLMAVRSAKRARASTKPEMRFLAVTPVSQADCTDGMMKA